MKSHQDRHKIEPGITEPKTILIKDGSYVITENDAGDVEVTKGQSILIENGIITELMNAGQEQKYVDTVDEVYDAGLRGGIVITPGFVNAHSHPPMYLLRSTTMLANDAATTEQALEVARKIEQAMTIEDQRYSALGDLTEQQKHGTTTVLSHYHTPEATRPAALEAGIRLVDAISVASRTDPTASLAKAELTLQDKYITDASGLISAGLTIHTLSKVSHAELVAVAKVLDAHPEALLTIHCGETLAEVEATIQRHGLGPIETLQRANLLRPQVVLSHAVHFTDEEIELIVKHKVGVVHLPTSNRMHKSGTFRMKTYAAAGGADRVALGTDSVISKSKLDIISEAFQAKMMHQDSGDPIEYDELFKMMTSNGARVLGKEKEIGRIAVGYKADLAFWKLKDRVFVPYDPANPHTIYGNLITHADNSVRDLMINGRFVINGRYHQLVNESRLLMDLQNRHLELRHRIQ